MPPARLRIALLAPLLLAFGACSLPAAHQQAVPTPPAQPAAVQDPLSSIQRYEAARSDGEGFLQFQIARGEEPVRVRAAVALGRLPFPEQGASVSTALVGGLDDISPRVRAAAAFALGMRGDPATAGAIAGQLAGEEPDVEVRARLVEAASRIDEPRMWRAVLDALGDKRPAVRAEAALGPSRWKASAPDAAAVDAALLALAGPRSEGGQDPELRWRVLFTLARRKCAAAREVFKEALADRDPRARLCALQGLGNLPPAAEGLRGELALALADHDWRVVCEALVALGKRPDPSALEALAPLLAHPSAHVRRCLFEALGSFKDGQEAALALLEKARLDASPNVRAAAIAAGAKLVGDAAAPDLELRRLDKDARIRVGAATGFAELSDALAVPALLALSRDADLRVAGVALEGLAKHLSEPARARLLELLESGDNGLALGAVQALGEKARESDLPALEACWKRAQGDIASELKAEILKCAAKIGTERARQLLAQREPPRRRTQVGTLETYRSNPRVEVRTTRGTMLFELFPAETPLHVHNFLELARRGYYTDLPFHRVVPDFVIQGGDYRGDGNGGKTWDGELLPAEFTPRKFARGALGMPRNDDPDSGGSQIFVTHRETPHLDGRYTVFGQLLEGGEVLDAIEVGDRILSVKILPPEGSR
jgi:cyclophilin family peptidyl-prolyl cis-trans isomerase/HEAT repeat protein